MATEPTYLNEITYISPFKRVVVYIIDL